MNWYRMMYEGKPERTPEKPRPTGFRLFLKILAENWWELIGLNILFFFSCLPVLTIPAGLCAMTRVCIALLQGEHMGVLEGFLKAFRQCFLRAAAAGGILAAGLGVSGFGVFFYGSAMAENGLLAAPAVILLLVFLVLLMAVVPLCQMVVFSELGIWQMVKNAVLLTLIRPLRHLMTLAVLTVLIAAYVVCFPYSTVALAAIALSVFWLFACNTIWPVTKATVFDA